MRFKAKKVAQLYPYQRCSERDKVPDCRRPSINGKRKNLKESGELISEYAQRQ